MISTETKLVLEVKHLQKSFGSKTVLKNINLTLAKGENLVVLGKSGSGKSVLIKCIVRLIEPDAGTLTVLGENCSKLDNNELNALRKKIGFLFQSAALYDSMTVRENLEFQKKYKTSSIIISHDMACAKITADRIIVLRDGVCSAEGTYDELKHSKDKWIHSFFE